MRSGGVTLNLTRIVTPLLATLVGALGVLGLPTLAASAGEERVYQDVNQPRYADTDELAADSDLIVEGTVSATTSQTDGLRFEEVHEVEVIQTLEGRPPSRLQVVQVSGSTDGAMHVEGLHELDEGADYVLFLAASGDHYRTVGGAQGVFVPHGSGWVSTAPDRQDLTLGALPETRTTDRSSVTLSPAMTQSPAVTPTPATASPTPKPATDTATHTSPAATEMPDGTEGDDGLPLWLLGIVFFGGLALGAAATLGLVRRPVTARQQAVPPRAPHREGPAPRTREPVARPPSPDRPAPESAAAAVQGLIAVGDLTDSPVMLAQVERSLRQSGVSMVTAEEGQPFDTEWHHGVGVLPAPRPDLNLTVARVVRPGWRSVDGLLRPVEVEVYRTDIP